MTNAPEKPQSDRSDETANASNTESGSYMLFKILRELGPLMIFFVSFKFGDLMFATAMFMGAMTISMAASWVIERHISVMLWVTFAIVVIMGALTLYLQNETFVKMKPTIINGIFATVLFVGLMTGRPLIKVIMKSGIPEMRDEGWYVLSRNWAGFFAFMALLNEIVWRTQTTDDWVDIKTFAYLPITLVFTFAQVFTIQKYMPENALDTDNSPD